LGQQREFSSSASLSAAIKLRWFSKCYAQKTVMLGNALVELFEADQGWAQFAEFVSL